MVSSKSVAYCLLALAIPAVLLAQEQSPQQLYADAVRLQQSGQLEAAAAKYEAFLKQRPEFVPAWSNLSVALAGLGRYDEAIRNYHEALKREPQNSAVRLNLALAYYKQAEFAKAAEELVKVRAQQPENQQAAYLLADSYLRLGEDKNVIALLEPMEAAHPEDRTIAYLLGAALIRDGQVRKGQRIIDRILRNGESAEVQMLIGAMQLSAGEYEKALATLTRAVELSPKLPGVQSLYGRAKMENDDPEAAKAAFLAELASDPNDFDSNLHLGALLRMERRMDEAAAHIRRALRVRPASLAARYQIASIDFSQGRAEDARKTLESVVAESPGFLEAHVQLAAVYYKLNRKEDGLRQREIVRKLNEENRKSELERD
ncbi:MAG: tetratricopeptide repeat protein [Bryobacteraceae bacterium]|nr:tetratricopeptide repeat protein [Bryobacteraceae bacterium]